MGFVEIHLHEFYITLQLMNAQHTGMLWKVISCKGNCIMYAFWIHLQVLYTDSVSTLAAASRETWSMSDPWTLFNFMELLGGLLTWRLQAAQAGLGPVGIWPPLKKSQWKWVPKHSNATSNKTTREMPEDIHNYFKNFPTPKFFRFS